MFVSFATLLLALAASQESGGSWEHAFARTNTDLDFCASIVVIDDLNGDGVPEVAAGSRGNSGSNQTNGAVEILDGADGTLIRSIQSPFSSSLTFGVRVASISDLDGDGFVDLVISAPYEERVEVHSSMGGALGVIHGSGQPNHWGFATSIATISDIDGDGFDDILIGIPSGSESTGAKHGGAFELYSGVSLGLIRRWEGPGGLGVALGSISDYDGDGIRDILASAPRFDDGTGAIFLYSSGTGAMLRTIRGRQFGEHDMHGFTEVFCTLPDLDGDGKEELLASSDGYGYAQNWGAFWVIGSVNEAVLFSGIGAEKNDRLGHAVAAAGDFNGDGIPDFLVSDTALRSNGRGAVYVYSGANGKRIASTEGDDHARYDIYGAGIVAMGDHQDSYLSILAGGTPAVQRLSFKPFLRASEQQWSLSSSATAEFAINFPSSAAGAPYFLLASASGIGSISYGVEIPLRYDRAFAWTWQGQSSALDRAGWRGQLDANGDATAQLAPAATVGSHLIGSYHLAAVALQKPGGLAEFASYAVPFSITP